MKLRSRLFQMVPSLLLGMALLGLAAPRTIAAWSSLDALPAFESLWAGKRPSDDDLAAAAAGLTRSVSAVPTSDNLVKLGEIELTQASGTDVDRAARSDLLAKAERHLTDAVMANPAQTFGWLSLAEVRITRGASGRDVTTPLMQSLDISPNVRLAWIPRAGLLLRYWQFLDIDELPAFSAQIQTIWSAGAPYRTDLIETAIGADEMEVVAAVVSEPPPTPAELLEMQRRKALRIRPR